MTTTKTNRLDGEDCSEDFNFYLGREIPATWIRQEGDEAARLLIRDVLGTDGIPMEGSTGAAFSISFQREIDGLGYTMCYEAGETTEYDFAMVTDAHVIRDSRWDRKAGESFVPFEIMVHDEVFEDAPAITFATTEEYEAQCDRCTKYGIEVAVRRIWEAIKADMEKSWNREEQLRDYRCVEGDKAARRNNLQTKRRLDAYAKAMEAIGCTLTVIVDQFDSCRHIFDVCATTKENGTIGAIRSYAHGDWC